MLDVTSPTPCNQPNQPREQWYKLDHVSTGEIRLVLTLLVDGAPPPSAAASAAPIAESQKVVKTVTGVRALIAGGGEPLTSHY